MPLKGNAVVGQSGGPTAVINASLAGVIEEALEHAEIQGVYGGVHGVLGMLREDFIDLGKQDPSVIRRLRATPSAALGSCRHKVSPEDCARLVEIFKKYDIRYFFYIGGNDSADTSNKVSKAAKEAGYELAVVAVPKTIDNDLAVTDHSPGYGSVARWVATAVRDAGLDTEAIGVVDNVKVIEVMGRNAGWITAATVLARDHEDAAPHLVYLPERPFNPEKFLADVKAVYDRLGHCVVTVCEGLKDEAGRYVTASSRSIDTDKFGHKQLGGVGEFLCDLVATNLKIKARCDKPGTIQRVSAALASPVDVAEAYEVGRYAVRCAIQGVLDKMVVITRKPGPTYEVDFGTCDLAIVANAEKHVPSEFISEAGNDVTEAFIEYALPLIGGPLEPYARLKRVAVRA
ncbi:MAG: 6-phosphofructokinase [Firmicutes bacterium]|jgi:6-phosphofructokinase 1|nr:6-phosphofructokinase [Bacillota bacterium]MDH7494726.1 6-phosphofructokinase [Bacillota bacterium]